jgi:hypothetical protein
MAGERKNTDTDGKPKGFHVYFFCLVACKSLKQPFAFGYHAINAEIEAPGRI